MKTTAKVLFAALMISAFAFEGCKKGDGDPFLSLRSRKARVAGDWTVSKGDRTHTYVLGNTTFTSTGSYDGTTNSTVTTPGNSTTTDKYTITYTFDKAGTYTAVYTDNNNSPAQTTTTKGNWNFTGGVGDEKNKSQLMLIVTSDSDSQGTTTYSGTDAPTFVYDIYELKSKEMVLKSSYTQGSETDNSSFTLTAK